MLQKESTKNPDELMDYIKKKIRETVNENNEQPNNFKKDDHIKSNRKPDGK